MPRKKSRKKNSTNSKPVEEMEPQPTQSEIPETTVEALKRKLDAVKDMKGVIGYILRNSRSATIDVKDPAKIIDYAILSSSAMELGKESSRIFSVNRIKKIIVEGEDAKLLSFSVDDNNISVFVEKNTDVEKIYRHLA